MASLFFLFAALLFLFQIPSVQTYFANAIASFLVERTGYTVQIEKAYLTNFDLLRIQGLEVQDQEGDSIISLQKGEIQVHFLDLYTGKRIPIHSFKLDAPYVFLKKNENDEIELKGLVEQLFPGNKNLKPKEWRLENCEIINGTLRIAGGESIRISPRFQFNVEEANAINLKLRKLESQDDSLSLQIEKLGFSESITQTYISLTDSDIGIGKGNVKANSIELSSNLLNFHGSLVINLPDSTKDQKLLIRSGVQKIEAYPQELARFLRIPEIKRFPALVGSGKFSLSNDGLEISNAKLGSSRGSSLSGNLYLDDPKNLDISFIQARLTNSTISGSDLEVISKELNSDIFFRFNYLTINSFIEGFVNDFVAKGSFRTGQGTIIADLNFKQPGGDDPIQYSGVLGLRNFNIGELTEPSVPVESVNLRGTIIGQGINEEELSMIFEGNISSVALFERNFQDIELRGNLSRRLFSGMINSRDEKVDLILNGLVDLNDSAQVLDLTLDVNKADLQALGLTTVPAGFQFSSLINIENFNPDLLQGSAVFSGLEAYNDENQLKLDSIGVLLSGQPHQRQIELLSDFFDLKAEGAFTYDKLKIAIPEVRNLIETILDPNVPMEEKGVETSFIHVSIELKNLNPVLGFLRPGLVQGGKGLVEMDYFWGAESHLDMNIFLDTLYNQGAAYIRNHFHFYLGRDQALKPLLGFEIQGEEQIISPSTILMDTKLLTYFDRGELHFNLSSRLEDEDWFAAKINGTGQLENNSILLKLEENSSSLSFLGKRWEVNPSNQMVINPASFEFDSVGFSTSEESIFTSGFYRTDSSQFQVDLQEFNLVNTNPFIVHKLTGQASGKMNLESAGGSRNLFTGVKVFDLTFNDLLVGDLNMEIGRKGVQGDYDVLLNIDHLGESYFHAEGKVLTEEDLKLDLKSELREVDLHFLNPLLEGVLSDIGGQVSGNIGFSGTLQHPEVHGILLVNKGRLKVDYLNTSYRVEDQVLLGIDRIIFTNSNLFDQRGNPVNVTGGLFHDGFKDFVLDMEFDLDKNMVMDIKQDQNDLFFGTGVASGGVKLFGSVKDVLIETKIKTEQGTSISLPFDNAESVVNSDQIMFVSQIIKEEEEKKQKKKVKETKQITGLKLLANLEITQDAEIQILLDQSTDDRIIGFGNGELTMEIDTRGDFQMLGNYEIAQGTYNFTMLNIINKQFEIQPGSRISWTGDPYGGEMNVTGLYKQFVSLRPLMISADSLVLQTSQARRRYPTDVQLKLQGEVLTPDIEFDIDIKESPVFAGYDFNSDKLAFYNRIQNDADEMNRQVFSLIMLRRFSQDGAYFGQTASGNVSELLSNQLSNYLSQVDENFEIDFDISGFSEADLKNMQLRMSYQFMEGKLKVSREGGFYNSTEEADVSSVIGDWTIEYLLSDDGRLRVRVFNRNNPNVYTEASGEQTTTTGGFSLMYTQNFNNLGELFKRDKRSQ